MFSCPVLSQVSQPLQVHKVKIYLWCPVTTTAHEVRQRARCNNCGVKGNNTYQIVYTGNSDIAMDGAGVRSAKDV